MSTLSTLLKEGQSSDAFGAFVSTIQDVRTAEQKLQSILEELKRAGADDPQNLARKLTIASEEYAKAVRELK